MAKIWTRRIIAGTQLFANCPDRYKDAVIANLKEAVVAETISEHDFKLMTGLEYTA